LLRLKEEIGAAMKKRFHQNQSNQILEPFGRRRFFTQRYFVQKIPVLHLLLQIATNFIILAFFGAAAAAVAAAVMEMAQ